MDTNTILELLGTILNIIFLILVIKENIWCWLFGILGSLVSIYLFVETKLYSESILYSYYVVMGVYGWRKWSRNDKAIYSYLSSLKPIENEIIKFEKKKGI